MKIIIYKDPSASLAMRVVIDVVLPVYVRNVIRVGI